MNELKGRGLFVFSDPGGAKPLLALAEKLKSQLTAVKIISDRSYSFYSSFSNPVEITTDVIQTINDFAPDFIVNGTSYTSTLELRSLREGISKGIPSFSFVDHWTSIKERFMLDGELVTPDTILLVDEKAKNLALDKGFESSQLVVFGNPYHQYLQTWSPAISKEAFLRGLGIEDLNKKFIVYAPDPLSNVNGIGIYGFDEISATKQILELTKLLRENYFLILNPHPNQALDRIQKLIGDQMLITPPGTDTNTLMYYADAILGFFSNFLIEATILGKKVFRFFPAPAAKDPLNNMNIGKVVYPHTLVSSIEEI